MPDIYIPEAAYQFLGCNGNEARFNSVKSTLDSGTDLKTLFDSAGTGDSYVAVKNACEGLATPGPDDTAAIQANITAAGANAVIGFPTQTWRVTSLTPVDGQTWIMYGATLKHIDATLEVEHGHVLILINGKLNVTILGGTLDGNKSRYAAATVQPGTVGCYIRGAADRITLRDVTGQNFPGSDSTGTRGGDGFTIGASGEVPTNVALENCIGKLNVRQGLSIITGRDLSIRGGAYHGQTGTNPGCGIDIEPNQASDVLDNVSLEGVSLYNNNADTGDLTITNKVDGNVTVSACKFRPKSGKFGLYMRTAVTVTAPVFDLSLGGKGVWFDIADGARLSGGIFTGDDPLVAGVAVRVFDTNRWEVSDSYFENIAHLEIDQQISGADRLEALYGGRLVNCDFLNCNGGDADNFDYVLFIRNDAANAELLYDLELGDLRFHDTRSNPNEARRAIQLSGVSQAEFDTWTVYNLSKNGQDVLIEASGITAYGTQFLHGRTRAPAFRITQEVPTDGKTGILVSRNVGGTVTTQEVTMGATDSGGAGYKVLRVAN